jgi:transcriptional regulator with XRE-family HTH domain
MACNPLSQSERNIFAAKLRTARAILGWTQSDLAARVHLTQRSIHRLEQGQSEPKLATLRAFERLWQETGVIFKDRSDGGFQVIVTGSVLIKTDYERSHPAALGSLAPH